MKGLYAITDCDRLSSDSLISTTEQILRAGVVALQYRDKSGNHARRKYEAGELQQLCKEHNSLFIINDDLQLAVLTGSDGIHLGREDGDCRTARNELGTGAIIGVSCYNSLGMALAAQENGADYVAFGSFFPSPSKRNTVTAEPDIIKQAKTKISLPVAAIGGITPANCGTLIEHGADMLAVISSIYQAQDPYSAVMEFNRLLKTNEEM
ncbi:MAG: thiamine phosphate synthase [Gammaproteobacteria bacterium]|nr:thiamine phosphate synthase [Gammaproteobacteria bacterium]